MCSSFIFMRPAGMTHSAFSKSNSDHSAPISSPVRTKVSAKNFMAKACLQFPFIAFDLQK